MYIYKRQNSKYHNLLPSHDIILIILKYIIFSSIDNYVQFTICPGFMEKVIKVII